MWIQGALVVFFGLCGVGVVLSIALDDRRAAAAIAWTGVVCSVLVVAAGAARLYQGPDADILLWIAGGLTPLSLHVDALSAVFLCVTGFVYLSCSLYAPQYLLTPGGGGCSPGRFGALHFLLMASVVFILTAGDALSFLIGWECMTIASYLLVNGEREDRADPGAGYLMLAMSEAGFLAIVIAFLVAGRFAPGLSFAAIRMSAGQLSTSAVWLVFALGLLGFGVKAGLVPVNIWLPRAYAASSIPFVPVLAGVTLNLGFYGLLRLNGDLVAGHAIGTGLVALVTGSATALMGILYATTENDLKIMLAHSTIENAGIVTAGFGAFLVFRNSDHPVAAGLALTAALYHIVNHSMYKTLLFQGSGHLEAAVGTRDMDRFGGLARELPALSLVFLVGCLAIAAVPPFNGFVSEWLTLQALLRSALLISPLTRVVFALSGAALALTAALAVTCFVKTYAMTFLGVRRDAGKATVSRIAGRARFSMTFLAVACLLLGILPTYVVGALGRAVNPLASADVPAALVPPFFAATGTNGQLPVDFLQDFHNLGAQTGSALLPGRGLVVLLRGGDQNPVVFAMSPSYSLAALALFLFATWGIVKGLTRRRSVTRREAWAGGIPSLLPEMTYTATGFSNPVRVVFQAVFRPNIVEDTRETVAVHFRTAIRRRRDETPVIERVLFRPMQATMYWLAALAASMHHGRLNTYVAYVLGFLLLVLVLYRLT